MLARTIRQAAVKSARMASTKRSSVNGPGAFETMYQVFMKNNVTYVGTILVAAVVVEGVYGNVTNAIWESANRGRLYHHIDWSQFKTDDDEEEEEEDDE
ncbi:Ubiquinol cytochrome c reductase subunit qcr9, partial [Globisporangium splendens]